MMSEELNNTLEQTNPAADKNSVCMPLRSQFPFMWKLCLCYGICYLLFAYRNPDGIGSGIFAAISAVFLILIAHRLKDLPSENKTFSIHITWECIFFLGAAVLISIANCLTDNGFFLFFNHVGSFLLFSISCIKLFYQDKQWDFGKYTAILIHFWIQLLEVIPVPFQDWSSCHKKTEKKQNPTIRYVIIGIVIGLPILFITTMLLASADSVFSDLLEKIFDFEAFFEWSDTIGQHIILLPCGFVLYTLLLYLITAALCRGGLNTAMKTPKRFATPIAITIFGMVDVVYVVFSGIQFLYLFAGRDPGRCEYAQYARQGFFELLFVALINFFLVLYGNRRFTKNTALKTVMTITCLCTFVMTASSAYRMRMYIHAYHLTFLRVFVLWFLLLLSFFMAGSIISIYKDNWNSFRYCLFVLTLFYTVFALAGVDSRIARYNVSQMEKDLLYAVTTKDNHILYLGDYLPDGYTHSKAYAAALSNLKGEQEKNLGNSDIELINDYLSIDNLFYEYNDWGEYTLDVSASLYDTDLKETIFTWKHFNFLENVCYKKCKAESGGF
ncbi:MAG: DUF4173 domain-containing protein [Lachnospiraceae bacterium]|nr:DUF4173 domain-containing protein [Lachnospiraceae bacterium]